MGNVSDCYFNDDLGNVIGFLYIYIPVSSISVLLCLATVAVVCKQRLHKTLVYRLAMYQVLSAMEFSIIWIIASISWLDSLHVSVVELVVLYAVLMGSSFIKLMFTVWISIHLFALAVFHKNLQRLERLYVVSSLLIPLAVTIVLLGTNLTGCPAYSTYESEQQIIFIIIFAVLMIVSLLMVVMGTILCHRACRRRNILLSEYDKQLKKVLREMLPLLLYPIFFLLLATPLFGFTVLDYSSNYTAYTMTESFWFGIVAPFWSFTTSLLLISHLCVVRCIRKKKVLQNRVHRVRQQYKTEEGSVTINETTRLCQKSDTHFSAPTED